MKRALQSFSVLTAVGMFLVLLAGVLVTNTGSAEGCGHTWPLCHGEFRPMDSLASLIEYSHRVITGVVGIMVLVLAVWAWKAYQGRRDVKWLCFLSLFFLFLQSGLGATAVLWGQSKAVLALHFGVSSMGFASVLLLSVVTFQKSGEGNGKKPAAITKGYRAFVWLIFAYVYVLLYLGAYVRRAGAGLAINTWPLNNGQLIPDHLYGPVGINFIHRLSALIGLLLILWLFVRTKRDYPGRRDLYTGSLLCVITMVLQIFSGGYVILSSMSLGSLLLHSTFVSVFFGSLSYLCYKVTFQEALDTPASSLGKEESYPQKI
jgi:heme a synthase